MSNNGDTQSSQTVGCLIQPHTGVLIRHLADFHLSRERVNVQRSLGKMDAPPRARGHVSSVDSVLELAPVSGSVRAAGLTSTSVSHATVRAASCCVLLSSPRATTPKPTVACCTSALQVKSIDQMIDRFQGALSPQPCAPTAPTVPLSRLVFFPCVLH